MQDCLELILNPSIAIFVNRRYYKHFIKKIHDDLKLHRVLLILNDYYRREANLYSQMFWGFTRSYTECCTPYMVCSNALNGRGFNILYDSIRRCQFCPKYKSECDGHLNSSDILEIVYNNFKNKITQSVILSCQSNL